MNTPSIKTVLNWSSGKDAALALHQLRQNGDYDVTHLLTTVNSEHARIVMHGVREELLDAQAASIGLPLKKIYLPASPNNSTYGNAMQTAMTELKADGVSASAFGDIFLEDLKAYREQQLAAVEVQAVFPLWKNNTRALIEELEAAGIEAIIVCVNEQFLGKDFLGRKIDRNFLNDLPTNVDPCGENGEYHTFVCNAPYFSAAIPVIKREIVYKTYIPAPVDEAGLSTGFYFLDLDLDK